MSERYARAFARLRERGEGAFVPFTVLGDPNPEASLEIVRALVRGGADMLELGLPFSDPIADGPTIQAADVRALAAGTTMAQAWAIIAAIREAEPALPIGLLVYANLVETHGARAFYSAAAAAGVDSVLVADVPSLEAAPYAAEAQRAGIAPVLIATPSASDAHLERIAALCRGYTYVVTRAGVTGAEAHVELDHRALLAKLRALGAPPPLLGFGISTPEHVRTALQAGAAGAISGSAIVSRIAEHGRELVGLLVQLERFVREMKRATALGPAAPAGAPEGAPG